MKQTPKLKLVASVSSRAEADGLLSKPGDAVLIERGSPRWLLLSCPCGCGEQFPINLDSRAGKAWRYYRSDDGALSIFPSVWRDTGCQSHYVIWRDRILLFGGLSGESEPTRATKWFKKLRAEVLRRIPRGTYRPYFEIADEVREIPWDILEVCRELKREGLVIEGEGDLEGTFAANSGADLARTKSASKRTRRNARTD